MQTQIRPWMLVYTIAFGLLSVRFVYSDFSNHYPAIVSIWAGIYYAVIFVGNLVYSRNRVPASFRTAWKIVFPLLILQFVFSGYYDSQHGKHAQSASVVLFAIASVIAFLLFLPTFRAHYLIGYGKQVDGVA
jgi:hypothetical protein